MAFSRGAPDFPTLMLTVTFLILGLHMGFSFGLVDLRAVFFAGVFLDFCVSVELVDSFFTLQVQKSLVSDYLQRRCSQEWFGCDCLGRS